jgi:hypothetical protein
MSKPGAQLRHRRESRSKETTMNVQRLTSEEAVRSGTGRGLSRTVGAPVERLFAAFADRGSR